MSTSSNGQSDPAHPRLYDVNGVLLQVDSDTSLLARMADYLLGPLTSRRLAPPDWTLRQLGSV